MTTGATGQLGLALPVQGELSGTWGDTVNNGITQYTNIAIAATLTLTNDGAVTLANTTGDATASNITSSLTGAGTVTAQFAIVRVTGTLTTAKVVTAPSYSKTYTVVNAATGGIVTFKASGQTGVSIAVGESAFVYYNGTDYVKVSGTSAVSSFTAGTTGFTPSTATTGAVTLAGTLATTNGGTGLTSFTSGGVVYASSSSALATGGVFKFDGANIVVNATTPAYFTGTSNLTQISINRSPSTGTIFNASQSAAFINIDGDSAGSSVQFATASAANTQPSEKMRLNGSGNLGLSVLNSISPWSVNHIALQSGDGSAFVGYNGNNQTYVVSNAYNDGSWKYKNSSGAGYYAVQGVSNGLHAWYTAPSGTAGNAISFTQAMTLDASGNLGVGTTSPSTFGKVAIQVTGSTTPTTGANVGPASVNMYVGANGGTDSTTGIFGWFDGTPGIGSGVGFSRNSSGDWGTQIRFYTHPTTTSNIGDITERMRLSSAGGFSVGTTADPGAGAIYATGNITAYYSDARLKTVSGKIENALDKVAQLSGVYYTNNSVAKSFGYDSDEVQVGVLAQDVEAVLPQIVKAAPFDLDQDGNSKSGENYKTVQYERLVPLLIEAINELRAEVKALKGV